MNAPIRRPRHQFREQLRELLNRPGPYLSMYLDRGRGDLVERFEHVDLPTLAPLQRQEAVRQLSSIDTVEEEGMVAMIVALDGAVCAATFPDPPSRDLIEVSDLPRLGPFIESEQSMLHHVVVIIGDEELSIGTYPRHGDASHEHHSSGDPAAAADVVANIVRRTHTPLVILCGEGDLLRDLHSTLRSQLPADTALVGVRSGQNVNDLSSELTRTVADRSARRTVEMLRLFRFQRSHDEAVEGVIDVVHALERREVAALLIHDDPDDERQAWFGSTFDRLAFDMADASPIDPTEELRPGRLVDVVLRAALGQDCPAFIVPALPDDRLQDGIGALLASDPAQRSSLHTLVEP